MPAGWFAYLIVAAVLCSIVLQVVWLSPWAILPLIVNALLLWAVLGMRLDVTALRG